MLQGARSPRVLIIGGGIAGVEALLALSDLAGERLRLTLVTPEPDFTYMPMIVEEPFSSQPAARRELAPVAAELGANFVRQAVAAVDPAARRVELADSSTLDYEAAVVSVGARLRAPYSRATTFHSAGASLRLAEMLSGALGGVPERIAFLVPPGNAWPLPIYELALMTQRRCRELGLRDVEHVIYTPEEEPLILFGRAAAELVSELLRGRGIEIHPGCRVHEDDAGELSVSPSGEAIRASHFVALPELIGPAIPGVPVDSGGFIPIDGHARVKGADNLYAAGDGTNFPIKQGGLGTQQADAAAEHIAARFGADVGEPRSFEPVLRGILLTGDESVSFRQPVGGSETRGEASLDRLWWPPEKVSGRYLAPWMADGEVHVDPSPPSRSVEIELALPKEWHREPMALDPFRAPTVE